MAEVMSLTAPDGTALDVYLARPAGVVRGGIVLVHEIWGLTDHIRRVADRLAAEGWLVAAPDILSRAGVTPAVGAELFALTNDPDETVRVSAQPRMRAALTAASDPAYAEWAVGALRATVDELQRHPGVDDHLGVLGFCFGGTYTFLLAAADDRIRAAAPFYGAAPDAGRIATIHAPVLALYGAHDPRLIDALPDTKAAFAAAGVDFTAVVYPAASHAFFNDTGSRYDADVATDAWQRVREFLAQHV